MLSGGRFVLGVGSGWNIPEMEALGYPFTGRTRRFEEQLEVLRSAWSGRPAAYSGTHVSFGEGIALFPQQFSPWGVPTLVGGMAEPAIGRAARSSGWLGISAVHRWDLDAMRSSVDVHRRECERADMPTCRPAPG